MRRFISAGELKQSYDIFGHFYSVELASGETVECRSVLEIANKSLTLKDSAELSKRNPDAVFILMNPGSSQSLVPVNNHILENQIGELPISLVPTKPDATQYQVMRVMHFSQWHHVRVLNLSDLRCSASEDFFEFFRILEDESEFYSHSIFSNERKFELATKLPQSRTIPLVLAWGLTKELDPLIERCRSKIDDNWTIKGVLKEGTSNKYRHPLPKSQPQQVAWLDNMIRNLRSSVRGE